MSSTPLHAATLCQAFQESVQRWPEQVLVHHRGTDWTYARIGQQATALARWLMEHGLQPGDRVALLAPNSARYVASYFGIQLAGGIVVGLNPETTPRELLQTLVHSEPVAIIAAATCYDDLAQVAPALSSVRMLIQLEPPDHALRNVGKCQAAWDQVVEQPGMVVPVPHGPADVAQIIYTSGTTGRPKGVTLSHGNLLANCRSIVEYLRLTSRDSVLVVLPFYYSYGNSLLFTHAAVGGRLILASDFVFWNRTLELMKAQQATGLAGVPATYAILLHRSRFTSMEFPHLRYLTCAGGALPTALTKRIRELLPHVRIFPMYGQTEATARLSALMPEDVDRKPGSIGRGIPGVRLSVLTDTGQPVAVGEIGEIVAQGANIMLGYWKAPEATADVLCAEGLWTGDMARVDEDGDIFITGRRSDMIKSGAYRIHPQEIEDVVLELEGVAEAAVASRPDAIQGELPVVFVVRTATHRGLTEEHILQHCRTCLPRYKQPREVCFTSELPRTTSGKVKRHELRQRLLADDRPAAPGDGVPVHEAGR